MPLVLLLSAGGGEMEFLRSKNSKAKNRHGGRFLAAQGIEAEILFCRSAVKKIGAESPVSGRNAAGNAPKKEQKFLAGITAYPEKESP
jgi:hypothetical protein